MMRNRALTGALLALLVVTAAIPAYAQERPPPDWQPPSNIDIYAGTGFKAIFFDDWRALPVGTNYEFGYLLGVEGGLRLFIEPYYVSFGVEGWLWGEAEVTGAVVGGSVLNHEEFMSYGIVSRIGNGSINYNFALQLAGGYFHIDEEISLNGVTIASADDDNWYFRFGVTFERVLFGDEYGLRVWIGLDLDYTMTGIKDRLDGKDCSFYGLGIRLFVTF